MTAFARGYSLKRATACAVARACSQAKADAIKVIYLAVKESFAAVVVFITRRIFRRAHVSPTDASVFIARSTLYSFDKNALCCGRFVLEV